MCPDKLQEFEKVCLSRRTITRRIENINKDVVKTFRQRIGEMEVFSIACDESTDISDTAQFGIFIRGVNEDFTETEELLAFQSMKGTTKGEDIFGEIKKVFNTYNLHWSKLCGISTDGTPAMIGVRSGLVHRIKEELRNRQLNPDTFTASLHHTPGKPLCQIS